MAEVAGVLEGLSSVRHCVVLDPGASAASINTASLATASCSVELLDDLLHASAAEVCQVRLTSTFSLATHFLIQI